MVEAKEKKSQNTEEQYNDTLVSEDPTEVSNEELENLAKAAIKKFKSLE